VGGHLLASAHYYGLIGPIPIPTVLHCNSSLTSCVHLDNR